MAYGDVLIQSGLNFTINRGEIFIVMGGSGCGKSTLLRHLVGLQRPAEGRVLYGTRSFFDVDAAERERLRRSFGVLYQSGALWSSLTLGENIALPLQQYHRDLPPVRVKELAALKLALVGLPGFEDYYPSEISGGMKKRAGLARALALDPGILFFDEPSAGLDPVSSNLLDKLILDLRDSLGATIVIVTHELASIFAIGDNSVFLDAETKTMIAQGNPRKLLAESKNPKVIDFLTRGRGGNNEQSAE
jgi:phospholipid/cholesterol/gamma-HCH transport system ATP-binding protein